MNSERKEALVSATSLNGEVEYTCSMDFSLNLTDRELELAFRNEVIEQVRAEHGSSPFGVPYLADLRTIRVIRL